MRLVDRLRGETRSTPELHQVGGLMFPTYGAGAVPGAPYLEPSSSLAAYAAEIHSRHPIVSAAVAARSFPLSQIRFRYREPGSLDLVDDRALNVLNVRPAGMTRPAFLSTLQLHDSYAGNAYVYRRSNGGLAILDPDRVTVVMGVDGPLMYDNEGKPLPPNPLDIEVLGYIYRPVDGTPARYLLADEVAHWYSEPDPVAWWRGQSWVTSALGEVAADNQSRQYVRSYYEHGATPNIIVTFDATLSSDQVREYGQMVEETNGGAENAGRTMVLGGGAHPHIVGGDLSKLGLSDSRAGHDTRIALRSRVPAPILQISEGLGGSALNAGNYSASRRMWVDGWFAPTADGLCEALAHLVASPGRELTYDPSQVLLMQEDRKDEADIQQTKAQAIRALVEAGYDADSVVAAITSGDMAKLRHSGLFSVQLQPAGAGEAPLS